MEIRGSNPLGGTSDIGITPAYLHLTRPWNAYDRADRMLTSGATAVTVDANGNLVAKGADTFAFDQANRLASATVAGATETYTYDGDGTRFSRQVGTDPALRYVSDVTAGLPVTIDDGTRKYVYGQGLAYAVSGTTVEVYHTDRLGSVRALTDGSGTVTATYRNDEWGLPTASSGSSTQPFSFAGEPKDATGLTYLRARYYDPDLGRFTSRDTWTGSMATSVTQNRYTYANNNPTTFNDPSGHCVVDAFADIAFIIFDGVMFAFGPEKERALNAAALLADGVLLLVPCGTGGGFAVRSGDEAINWLGDVGRACSFTPETLVATPTGNVPISSIEVGDIVLAWDEASGAPVERTVTAVLAHPDDEITKLMLDGVVITTTPDHPFYTLEAGWIDAGLLWPGAHVRTKSGSGVVTNVETTSFQGTLWDLTVQGAGTFFVGGGGALVHNCPVWRPPPGSFTGRNAIADAARKFGIDRRALGDYVEDLKRGMGRRGDQNVTITPTGDIVMPESGESLGSVFDLLGGQ